jgi:hypothetical protein
MPATIRAAPSVVGKSSRVTPMKVRTSAHTASAMPQKWKAFTAAKATGTRGRFTRKSPAADRRARTYAGMAQLLDSIISVMGSPRGRRPICLVCGRPITEGQERMRLRGETRGASPLRDLRDAPSPRGHRAARLPASPLSFGQRCPAGIRRRPRAVRTRAGDAGVGSACGPRRGGCGGRRRGCGRGSRSEPPPSRPSSSGTGGSLIAHQTIHRSITIGIFITTAIQKTAQKPPPPIAGIVPGTSGSRARPPDGSRETGGGERRAPIRNRAPRRLYDRAEAVSRRGADRGTA